MFGFRKWLLRPLNHHLWRIRMDQAQLAAEMQQVSAQLDKIGAESAATLQKVADLEAALASSTGVSQEVQDAFTALKAQVQRVDDMVPDAAPAPAPEPAPAPPAEEPAAGDQTPTP